MPTIIIGRSKNNKGASIDNHIKWIDNELSPPCALASETIYVLKCFKETLELLKKQIKKDKEV
jgi:hypothetical protein